MEPRILGSGAGPTLSQQDWTAGVTALAEHAGVYAREAARQAAKQPITIGPVYPSCPIVNWRKHTLTTDPLIDAEGCGVCGGPWIVAYGTRVTGATVNTHILALCADHAAVWAAMMGYRRWEDAAEGVEYRACAYCELPVALPAAVRYGDSPDYLHADCAQVLDLDTASRYHGGTI